MGELDVEYTLPYLLYRWTLSHYISLYKGQGVFFLDVESCYSGNEADGSGAISALVWLVYCLPRTGSHHYDLLDYRLLCVPPLGIH